LVLGADLAGIVVDPGDSDFAIGELVFGVTNARFTGAQAGYAVAEARRLTRKPAGLSFLAAAAVPVVAVTAASMLFELGELRLGQRVLIHGGAGSVGSLAVQLAKRAGAEVIATAFAPDVDRTRALGADQVINISDMPFVGAVKYADLVIDTVGGVTQTASFDVLVPGGRLVSSVSEPDQELAAARHVKARWFIVDVTRERLERLVPFLEDPRTVILVGDVLPLRDVAAAHEMLAGRPHKPGKIVLRVGDIPSELLP
jgi:NADPH:quinone reductase-like Zn-dependent oxidoreductase